MRTAGRVVVGLALLAAVLAVGHGVRGKREAARPGDVAAPTVSATPVSRVAPVQPPQSRMVVAFRMDRDITRGHYLGDRWVSPPTFAFAQAGDEYVTHAKLQAVGDDGMPVDLSGEWSTSNPAMIAISRDAPGEVTIVVREAGEADLVASAGGQRKVLRVTAIRHPDAMEVAFAQ